MGNLMGNWYSLDCKYYTRQFPTLDALLNDILDSGQDPNYEILKKLAEKGVVIVTITLHVGYGTFLPVRVSDIRDHKIHSEWYSISKDTANSINRAKTKGRRIIAVGTTCVRALEYASNHRGTIAHSSGSCDLFIYPGYRFNVVDAMITNFHLPKSTLLMLVSAFAGREKILNTYRAAIDKKYRLFSYGDAMFIA